MKNIENYIVVIPGASAGIGSAIISALTSKVYAIMRLNRKHENISIVKKTKIEYVKTDLDKMNDWDKIVNLIIKNYNKIDLFINCIGDIITGRINDQQIPNLFDWIYSLRNYIGSRKRISYR